MKTKVIPFKIPKSSKEFVRFQVDSGRHFYDKLHQHPEWQLTLIEAGRGQLMVGDYIGRFGPGDAYLFSANLPHVFRSDTEYFEPNAGNHSLGYTLFFDFEALGQSTWEVEEFTHLHQWQQHTRGSFAVLGEAKEYIQTNLAGFGDRVGLDKLQEALAILVRLQHPGDLKALNQWVPQRNLTETEGKRMGKVMSFILSQCHRNIQLQEAAEVAIMSREAFCRFFKERTGKTFTEYLNLVRIHQASQLLMESDLTISQIGFQSGFQNLSYFNRTFRKFRSETPKEFRKRVANMSPDIVER